MTTICTVADLHSNSTVAICPPVVQLDDGGSYHPSRSQRELWDNWLRLVDHMKQYEGFILEVNGDAIEGDAKNRSYQIISRNESSVLYTAAKVLDPLAKLASMVYIVRGTEAHVGKSGNLEESLARDLDAVQCPTTKAYSWWELPLAVEGKRIHFSHHATMGGLPWTKPQAAQKLAAKVLFEYSDDNDRPPDLVIRSHMHQWSDSYDAHRTRAIITPAWTWATSYVHKVAPDTLADIGALIIHVGGGKYEIEKFKVKPSRRVWVSPKKKS